MTQLELVQPNLPSPDLKPALAWQRTLAVGVVRRR